MPQYSSMRNDVSSCAVFCVGLNVQGGHVLWEDHGGEWVGVGGMWSLPAAAASICPWGSVSPHLMVLIHVVWWPLGGRSFGLFHILPGREEEWWPHECLVSHTWPHDMWSAVVEGMFVVDQPQGFEVSGKKKPKTQPLTLAGRALCPQDWGGLRKDRGLNVLWKIHFRVAVHRHCILTQNWKPRSFERIDVYTACK